MGKKKKKGGLAFLRALKGQSPILLFIMCIFGSVFMVGAVLYPGWVEAMYCLDIMGANVLYGNGIGLPGVNPKMPLPFMVYGGCQSPYRGFTLDIEVGMMMYYLSAKEIYDKLGQIRKMVMYASGTAGAATNMMAAAMGGGPNLVTDLKNALMMPVLYQFENLQGLHYLSDLFPEKNIVDLIHMLEEMCWLLPELIDKQRAVTDPLFEMKDKAFGLERVKKKSGKEQGAICHKVVGDLLDTEPHEYCEDFSMEQIKGGKCKPKPIFKKPIIDVWDSEPWINLPRLTNFINNIAVMVFCLEVFVIIPMFLLGGYFAYRQEQKRWVVLTCIGVPAAVQLAVIIIIKWLMNLIVRILSEPKGPVAPGEPPRPFGLIPTPTSYMFYLGPGKSWFMMIPGAFLATVAFCWAICGYSADNRKEEEKPDPVMGGMAGGDWGAWGSMGQTQRPSTRRRM